MFKHIKSLLIVLLTMLFLSGGVLISGCTIFKTKPDDSTEFIIKQVSRSLGYKISERKPGSVCKVKEVTSAFLKEAEKDDTSEEMDLFARTALNFISDQIHIEDEMIKLSLMDLIVLSKIDMNNIKIDDTNKELFVSVVKAYVSGMSYYMEEKSIECK